MLRLELVQSAKDIRNNMENFQKELVNHKKTATRLLQLTIYWVYDATTETFSPNKFVAYKNMTFGTYEEAQLGNFRGRGFDGQRIAIEKILGEYKTDEFLSGKLVNWAESTFYLGILDRININKWKFLYLPAIINRNKVIYEPENKVGKIIPCKDDIEILGWLGNITLKIDEKESIFSRGSYEVEKYGENAITLTFTSIDGRGVSKICFETKDYKNLLVKLLSVL
jgi:hypothetical protein